MRIKFSNPGHKNVLLFERIVEVDPALVQQYGSSWCAELVGRKWREYRVRWHNGDRDTIIETLEREITIMTLQRDGEEPKPLNFEGDA